MSRSSQGKKTIKHSGINVLYFTVLVTGASILAIEIAGTRLLSPFFGVTFYIWSALIVVTMLSLAVGYLVGGMLADKRPTHTILYRIILFSGIASMLIPIISPFLLNHLSVLEIRTGILLSAAIIFSPSLILLGMVTPYAVKLATPVLDILGKTVGRLYAIGTIGSCFGAVFAGFIIIPSIGVKKLFFIVALCLFALCIIHTASQKMNFGFFLSGIAAAVSFIFLSSFNATAKQYIGEDVKVLFETDTLYGQLNIIEKEHKRWLTIDLTANSGIDTRTGFSIYRYPYFFELMNYINPQAKNALFIGLGGGSVIKRFTDYGIKADAVEIDKKVVEAAITYFDFDDQKSSVFIEDGRRYVKTTDKTYDFLVVDVIGGNNTVPYHLFSREFFNEAKHIMNNNGIIGINYIGYATGKYSQASRSIYKTLKHVYAYVELFTSAKRSDEHANIIFLASDQPLELKKDISACPIPEIQHMLADMLNSRIAYAENNKAVILTDNYNPIQFLSLKSSEYTRKNTWEFLSIGSK